MVLIFCPFQASADQLKIDIVLVFYVGFATSLFIGVVTNVAVTCQVAWPSVIVVLPLLLLNIWYRVWCSYDTTHLMAEIIILHNKSHSYLSSYFFRIVTLQHLES